MQHRSILTVLLCLAIGLAGASAHAHPPTRSRAAQDADRAVHLADRAGRRLLGLLDQSRLAQNRQQVACLDRRLSQVNSFARALESRRLRLADAEQRGDEATVRHEHSVIRTIARQLREVDREGTACVVGPRSTDRRTIVEVTISRDVPNEDVSRFGEAARRRWE